MCSRSHHISGDLSFEINLCAVDHITLEVICHLWLICVQWSTSHQRWFVICDLFVYSGSHHIRGDFSFVINLCTVGHITLRGDMSFEIDVCSVDHITFVKSSVCWLGLCSGPQNVRRYSLFMFFPFSFILITVWWDWLDAETQRSQTSLHPFSKYSQVPLAFMFMVFYLVHQVVDNRWGLGTHCAACMPLL